MLSKKFFEIRILWPKISLKFLKKKQLATPLGTSKTIILAY